MSDSNYKRTKYACYIVNVTMSVVANFPPLLFITFHDLYGLSFSMLGTLIFINFITQLGMDLAFSFYSHKFNIKKVVKLTPVLSAAGLLLFTLAPVFKGYEYICLLCGTLIFSSSGGLAEVLISPLFAAIPSDDPYRDMSKLHSTYAWGVVFVIVISTLFFRFFGSVNWQIMSLLWLLIPLAACLLFERAPLPDLTTPEKASNVLPVLKDKRFLVCVFCIFFGGATECTMAQWCSSYIEYSLGIPKTVGDILGTAFFGLMLACGRTLYAKFGDNIYKVMLISSSGAVVCYLTASLSPIPAVGLAACALTGLCAAMLWPGSLIVLSDRFASPDVSMFALMAAGGDFGAAFGTQFVGTVTDILAKMPLITSASAELGITAEQLSLKAGLLFASFFPLCAMIIFIFLYKNIKSKKSDVQ